MLLQADVDVLPMAVLTYDLDGTVTSANQAAATLLGPDSLNGTNAARAGWLITDAAGGVEQIVVTLTDITQLLSDARLPRPGYGAGAVATVTDHIAAAKLDPQAILEAAVEKLAKLRSGTWLASLINKDPSTMRVYAASDVDPQIAEYI